MRVRGTGVAAAVLSALAAQSAVADEVFLCPDKKLVRIDAGKRAQQYEHPCVKAWFNGSGGQPVPPGARAPSGARPENGSDEAIRTTRAGIRR